MSPTPFQWIPQDQSLMRLFWMRLVVIASELLVIGVCIALSIYLPGIPLFTFIAIQMGWNSYTWIYARILKRHAEAASHRFLFIQFVVDILLLTGVLYYTGGSTNPFVSFYLPTVAVAATVLRGWGSFLVALCSIVSYSFLTLWYVPLHIMNHEKAMQYHLTGMWVNFIVSVGLISWFVVRVSRAVRARDHQLALAREHYLQSERIVALGSQAASAAHLMGTPLSTIAVIARELKRAIQHTPSLEEYREELDVIESQIGLCKQALDKMCHDNTLHEGEGEAVWLLESLLETLDAWRLRHPTIKLNRTIPKHKPVRLWQAEKVMMILTALLDNAAQATTSESEVVFIQVEFQPLYVCIQVKDHGKGISPEFQQHLGQAPVKSTTGGKGIGLMLAFHSAKQIGARISLTPNQPYGTIASLYARVEY
jgi:two-component system, sensor histidine kinase RegB